jgi:hypothetical protein
MSPIPPCLQHNTRRNKTRGLTSKRLFPRLTFHHRRRRRRRCCCCRRRWQARASLLPMPTTLMKTPTTSTACARPLFSRKEAACKARHAHFRAKFRFQNHTLPAVNSCNTLESHLSYKSRSRSRLQSMRAHGGVGKAGTAPVPLPVWACVPVTLPAPVTVHDQSVTLSRVVKRSRHTCPCSCHAPCSCHGT